MTLFSEAYMVSTSKIGIHVLNNHCQTLQTHTSIDILLNQLCVVVISIIIANWVNTLFQISIYRSQSHPTVQPGLPQPYFSPRSKYISEHGPHGPVPCSQKLSSFPKRKIRSLPEFLISLFQISKCLVILKVYRRVKSVRIQSNYLWSGTSQDQWIASSLK